MPKRAVVPEVCLLCIDMHVFFLYAILCNGITEFIISLVSLPVAGAFDKKQSSSTVRQWQCELMALIERVAEKALETAFSGLKRQENWAFSLRNLISGSCPIQHCWREWRYSNFINSTGCKIFLLQHVNLLFDIWDNCYGSVWQKQLVASLNLTLLLVAGIFMVNQLKLLVQSPIFSATSLNNQLPAEPQVPAQGRAANCQGHMHRSSVPVQMRALGIAQAVTRHRTISKLKLKVDCQTRVAGWKDTKGQSSRCPASGETQITP